MLKNKKILMAHSNAGQHRHDWHNRRKQSAIDLGYNMSLFSMTEFHEYTIFPYLDLKWKMRDKKLMNLYEKLGYEIDKCDVFIHYNGALIHPEFLEQFKKIKIYHCADDPDASNVISKPVALNYDICAISNPTSIKMYKDWGCKNIFFWPIGAYHFTDQMVKSQNNIPFSERDIPLIFIGSKWGVPSIRFIGKFLGLYKKRRFMETIEKKYPFIQGYGGHWSNGPINDKDIPFIYNRSRLGLNIHNSLGPVNSRLYDLAAFGVCQICDNKNNLHYVFEEGKEIIGFESTNQCIELIQYYSTHEEEAYQIANAARNKFLNEYTMEKIWINFFSNVNEILIKKQ